MIGTKKLKLSAFITYLVLFFSMIFVVIFLYLGINILLINIYKNNFFVSRSTSELLSAIMNSLFSSTNNITIEITFPKGEMEIYFFDENITVKKGKEFFSSKIFKPSYINFNISNNVIKTTSFHNTKILIIKINDEIRII
ncbi:MAG: hypothetical protein KQA34_02660 [Candidatus Aenigmarchaeota archaeon]|nr:hypothetical protein [Candidatus Aenigmarchaeota archaeon]